MVILRGDVDLAFAGQAPEGPGVVDAIQITLEAGTEGVWLFLKGSLAGTLCPRGVFGQDLVFSVFPLTTRRQHPTRNIYEYRAVGQSDAIGRSKW